MVSLPRIGSNSMWVTSSAVVCIHRANRIDCVGPLERAMQVQWA
jgi:hypothetical protein